MRITAMLRGGPLCVCQITAVVKLASSTVSAHLAELRRAGVIAEQRDGRWVEYRLVEHGPHRGLLDAIWLEIGEDPRVRADDRIVRELRRVPLDELCKAELDLARLGRPRLDRALKTAETIERSR